MLNSPRFVDKPPPQIYATLLDEGTYLCSISTMYRILARNTAGQGTAPAGPATRPGRSRSWSPPDPRQVYTWDITKLAGPVKGHYFDCYVMIDIYSRYIVGAHVHATESGPLAVEMMTEIFGVHGVPHVVHADRGTSMTCKPVATLLDDLGVTRSHSRPRVSNDNPFSEAWYKTLKYAPVFPERFGSLPTPGSSCPTSSTGYNHHHRHAGIGLHTPADVHYGLADASPRRTRTHPRPRPGRGTPNGSPPPTTQDPRPARHGLDQPTQRPGTRRLNSTPAGLIHLDKFR